MTKMKRLRIAMAIGCLFAVSAGVGYYLKSTDYETSGSSSASVLWLMLMVVAGAASIAGRRRKQRETDEKTNKTNA